MTDSEGRPIRGDLALTAFDKSLTYIQPEWGLGVKLLVAARKLRRWLWSDGVLATLNPRRFETSGSFMCPEFYLTDDYQPRIFAMVVHLPREAIQETLTIPEVVREALSPLEECPKPVS